MLRTLSSHDNSIRSASLMYARFFPNKMWSSIFLVEKFEISATNFSWSNPGVLLQVDLKEHTLF